MSERESIREQWIVQAKQAVAIIFLRALSSFSDPVRLNDTLFERQDKFKSRHKLSIRMIKGMKLKFRTKK